MSMNSTQLFPKIGNIVEYSDDFKPTVLESLCMNCMQQGETRLLLTSVPYFREVIISSFTCHSCGYKTTDVAPGGTVQPRGVKYNLTLKTKEDFNRQVVKSEYATIRLEELDFEIPPKIGKLTTIEGLLQDALEELRDSQEQRRQVDEKVAGQVEEFIAKLAMLLAGISLPVHFVVDDASGNSFIENPSAPKSDPNLVVKYYFRTKEMNETLGLNDDSVAQNGGILKEGSRIKADEKEVVRDDYVTLERESLAIPADCPNCHKEGQQQMCLTNIPFFKEIIIFSFSCEFCGFRNNEVKGGGAIPAKGRKIILNVPKRSDDVDAYDLDMSRDVVKSTSAGIFIPEIDLEVTHGSLGGIYTTVEGLLGSVYEKLFDSDVADDVLESAMAFNKGDSAPADKKSKMDEFQERFKALLDGERAFTFIVDDPLDNSFVFSPTAPDPEPRLNFEMYERSYDQNEEFGINDMRTNDEAMPDTESQQVHKTDENLTFAKMKNLQVTGKETHPNEDVVAKPEGF